MKPFQVGLLGAGVVGSGTFAVLQRNREEIRRRAGREIRISQVVDVDLARARRVAGDAAEVGNDARAVLARQRDLAHSLLTAIPGVSCVKPKAALYMFPKLDPKLYPIEDDQQFAYELLAEQKVLIVQGTGFNWPHPDHFRVVFLPNSDDLVEAMGRIATFLAHYRARHAAKSGSQPSFA